MEFTGVCSSPSLAFAGSLPLFAASTSPSPFAANVSQLVSLLAPPSSSSSPLVLPSPSSSPLVPSISALAERPLVPLGLLVVYEGMVWSPDPEPAPHQRPLVPAPRLRPPVPAPRQRPPVPAPRQRPPVPVPRKCFPQQPRESALPERPRESVPPLPPLVPSSSPWPPLVPSGSPSALPERP